MLLLSTCNQRCHGSSTPVHLLICLITHTPSNLFNLILLPPQLLSAMVSGARLPITHTTSTIPTSYVRLQLHNIFLSPTLIERLISIHKLTRDNNVSVKFDPYGFSIKDMLTKRELIRSDSHGDLYLLNFQQS